MRQIQEYKNRLAKILPVLIEGIGLSVLVSLIKQRWAWIIVVAMLLVAAYFQLK